jgi:hypothetical protein
VKPGVWQKQITSIFNGDSMKKIYIFNFVGFQFDDSEEHHQNGNFIIRAKDEPNAVKIFKKFFVSKHPYYSVLVERNFHKDGGLNKDVVNVTEVSENDVIITYDLGGY